MQPGAPASSMFLNFFSICPSVSEDGQGEMICPKWKFDPLRRKWLLSPHTPRYFHPERTSKPTKILCTYKLHILGRLTWIQPKETPVTSFPQRRPGHGAEHPLLLSPATTSLGNVGTWWAPSNRSHGGANYPTKKHDSGKNIRKKGVFMYCLM